MGEMQAVEATFPYPSYQVSNFHANSPTLSSTTVRPVLPTLTLDARQKRSRRGTLFAYWNYIAARTGMGAVVAMASSGGRFGVARPGVRAELIAFGHPRGIRGLLVYQIVERGGDLLVKGLRVNVRRID